MIRNEKVREMDLGLKPCPFCGGVAVMNGGEFGERFVTCSNDNCGGRMGTGIWAIDEATAMTMWNTRPPAADTEDDGITKQDAAVIKAQIDQLNVTEAREREAIRFAVEQVESVFVTTLPLEKLIADIYTRYLKSKEGRG